MQGSITLYEDQNYKGRRYHISLANKVEGKLYSIQPQRLNDKMSSIKWDTPSNVRVILYEHPNGTGRKYIRGGGKSGDKDTHNNDFKDCASSYRWYYENSAVSEHFIDVSKSLTRQFFDGLLLPEIHGKAIYYVKRTELKRIGTQILQVTFHLKADAPVFSDPSIRITVDTSVSMQNNSFQLKVIDVRHNVDSSWLQEVLTLGLQEILVDSKAKQLIGKHINRVMDFGKTLDTQGIVTGVQVSPKNGIRLFFQSSSVKKIAETVGLDYFRNEAGGSIWFYEDNNCKDNVRGALTDASGQKIDFTKHKAFANDDAKSMRLVNVRSGAKISVYDNSSGRTNDDYLVITVNQQADAICIDDLNRPKSSTQLTIKQRKKDGLAGKVSRVEVS